MFTSCYTIFILFSCFFNVNKDPNIFKKKDCRREGPTNPNRDGVLSCIPLVQVTWKNLTPYRFGCRVVFGTDFGVESTPKEVTSGLHIVFRVWLFLCWMNERYARI